MIERLERRRLTEKLEKQKVEAMLSAPKKKLLADAKEHPRLETVWEMQYAVRLMKEAAMPKRHPA